MQWDWYTLELGQTGTVPLSFGPFLVLSGETYEKLRSRGSHMLQVYAGHRSHDRWGKRNIVLPKFYSNLKNVRSRFVDWVKRLYHRSIDLNFPSELFPD